MSVSASASVARARAAVGKSLVPQGLCLHYVDTWMGLPGSKGAGAGKYDWAVKVWTYGTGKHAGDTNPPAGAPVVFGASTTRKDGNAPKGDVAISIGGGLIVATDASGSKVGIMTIAARAKQTQRPYLGWLDNWLGNPITGLAAASGGSAGSASIKTAQTRLNVWGAKLVVDGQNGPKTIAAVKAFQKAHNLTQDGIVGPKTTAALNGNPPAAQSTPSSLPQIQKGATGDAVKRLQERLKTNYPAYAGKLATDGIFGVGTKASVMEFQRRSGLTQDGIVGPKTWKALGF